MSDKSPGEVDFVRWAEHAVRPGAANDYLKLYFEKTALWGRYLTAQFVVSGTFEVSNMNLMQEESIGIRNSHAWSVPTPDALRLLAAEGPLLEVGCGNGLWAQLLAEEYGADIKAFDTAEWKGEFGERDGNDAMMGNRLPIVRAGGPEQVQAHPDRTLLLMWPDYGGRGSFGSACLEQYTGETLLLVGEWPDSTCGLLNPWGQSFSEEFVAAVEAGFELEQRLKLPCWPGALDSAMAWRRKRP